MSHPSASPKQPLAIPGHLTGGAPPWRRLLWLPAALALAGLAYFQFWRKPEPESVYQVGRAELRDIRQTVEAFGSLEAKSRTLVPAPGGLILLEIRARAGQTVAEGEVLAKLDARATGAAVAAARRTLSVTKARVDAARIAATQARSEFARLERLLAKGLGSQQQTAQGEAALAAALAGLRAAEAEGQLSQGTLEQAQAAHRATEVRAPSAGVILKAPRAVGALVGPNTGPLFELASSLAELTLTVPIPEADVGLIQPGQPARFSVPAYPTRTFTAAIDELDSRPIKTGTAVSYAVRLKVDNQKGQLLPGMTANVTVEVARAEGTLSVPESALRFQPKWAGLEASQRGQVWVVGSDRQVERRTVRAGISDGAFTAIGETERPGVEVGTQLAIGYARGGEAFDAERGPGISLGK